MRAWVRAGIAGLARPVEITAIVVILATSCGQHPAPNSAPSQTPTAQPATPSSTLPSGQTVLPFTGLKLPRSVAVDSSGTVYLADWGNNRVLKLAAGSSTQAVLPFTGLNNPRGVAVDTAGNVYVTDLFQQSGGETGGGVMRRTAGARGCRANPTEAT